MFKGVKRFLNISLISLLLVCICACEDKFAPVSEMLKLLHSARQFNLNNNHQ